MRRLIGLVAMFAGMLPASGFVWGQGSAPAGHVYFRVTMPASGSGLFDGRVLVFVKQGKGDAEVSVDEFHPGSVWVTGREVHGLAAGATVEVDGTDEAFPASFATMEAGDYEVQAVLDPEHTYNYSGRTPADWVSGVVALPGWTPGAGAEPVLALDKHAEDDPKRVASLRDSLAQAKPGVAEKQEIESDVLTRFWGRAITVKGWVILPPGYAAHPEERYPTVYWTHGFGGGLDYGLRQGLELRQRMVAGSMPPMIWVMLDESCPQGTHEFADSVNNGPWGKALTTEFIPALEQRYRMDAKPTGRLLNGHSSGGWATLQLQVNYPEVFGGTWSTSPDSSDFHDFTGPDLYAPGVNVYRSADGKAFPIMRDKGEVLATIQQFVQLEQVLGPWGGQFGSFNWVFSPRSVSGAPEPMFDRATGAVDPTVVAYWHDHYDLAHIVETTWAQRGALLKGRIHLFVGTADTFYLDGAAHKFEARLAKLGAEPHFTYQPGRTHFNSYGVGTDRIGLFDQITAEMYAVARPGVDWKKK